MIGGIKTEEERGNMPLQYSYETGCGKRRKIQSLLGNAHACKPSGDQIAATFHRLRSFQSDRRRERGRERGGRESQPADSYKRKRSGMGGGDRLRKKEEGQVRDRERE